MNNFFLWLSWIIVILDCEFVLLPIRELKWGLSLELVRIFWSLFFGFVKYGFAAFLEFISFLRIPDDFCNCVCLNERIAVIGALYIICFLNDPSCYLSCLVLLDSWSSNRRLFYDSNDAVGIGICANWRLKINLTSWNTD